MLTKPLYGWTDFQLDGTSVYSLSYMDDIPFEWVDQAIHGLETLLPFCVKGFLEPKRFLCTVSYWNCHIICEDDERCYSGESVVHEYSNTNMIQFCEYLYNDISSDIEDWASFASYKNGTGKLLTKKLITLDKLISEKREYFGDNNAWW